MTLVKICGISDPESARVAATCGADFIGMVFAPSRRQITVGQAKAISGSVSVSTGGNPLMSGSISFLEMLLEKRRPLIVGVFADQDIEAINSIADECNLDLIQISGSENWEVCKQINRPVLKCVKIREEEKSGDIIDSVKADAIPLLDSYVAGAYGGTGQSIDWEVAAQISRQIPIVLAGGLNPANVFEAINVVHPWAVDVSSGVETSGVKDPIKIEAFLKESKQVIMSDKRSYNS